MHSFAIVLDHHIQTLNDKINNRQSDIHSPIYLLHFDNDCYHLELVADPDERNPLRGLLHNLTNERPEIWLV